MAWLVKSLVRERSYRTPACMVGCFLRGAPAKPGETPRKLAFEDGIGEKHLTNGPCGGII